MKTLKNTALIALLAFLAFAAMVTAGLLYTVATAPPAHAGAYRPATPPPVNPLQRPYEQLSAEWAVPRNCVVAKHNLFDVRVKDAQYAESEELYRQAGEAWRDQDETKFDDRAAKVRAAIPALTTRYC